MRSTMREYTTKKLGMLLTFHFDPLIWVTPLLLYDFRQRELSIAILCFHLEISFLSEMIIAKTVVSVAIALYLYYLESAMSIVLFVCLMLMILLMIYRSLKRSNKKDS